MIDQIDYQISAIWAGFVQAIPLIFIAIFVLLVTGLVAGSAVKIADKITGKTELRPSLKSLTETMVRLAIWLFGIMLAAVIVFPDLTPGSLFAGLGIGAVAIGFAFRDIFENFLAGALIMLRQKMRIGDFIECEGISGKVEQISLRETHIRSASGELTVVPNSILFKNPVEILTDEAQRRYELVVGVSYDTNLDHAAEIIRTAIEDVDGIDLAKGIDVFAQEFNSSSIDFLVRWWAGSGAREGWETRDRIIRSVKQALNNAGIEIPFPHVTHTFREKVPLGQLPGEGN